MTAGTVRKSPALLPETAVILRLLAEITGRQPPAPEAEPPAEVAPPPSPMPPVEPVESIPPAASGGSAREFLGRVNWRNESAEAGPPGPADDAGVGVDLLPARRFFRRVNWRNSPRWTPPDEPAVSAPAPDGRTVAEAMAEFDWD